ncbi:cystathionine gamma-synthase [Phaeocystidibacter luteus]|uniref:Cystathionine gamma-synthase n=1 Tax=Phaeocystidibacter luteus TaxID=911197 RepID=A0A6N6REY7_9FLAO|nr:cystathionine gamma-synthase [Phaeocystidibacter luteus]KAB2808644.1 cystathionine gamma-synthase [Phaeocystidibacter luteus]
MKDQSDLKIGTLAIHGGQEHDPSTGAVMPPIYQTSTYAQAAPGVHKGYEYSRTGNPTRHALEKSIASLEGGKYGLAFGSGLAAVDCVLKMLKPGDEIISTNDLYGGSYRQFTKIYQDFGLVFHFTAMDDAANVEKLVNDKTKLIWVETPTNPMMNVIDIEAMAKVAKQAGAMLVVDNTFATPILQRPIELGADIVLHSATKYLGGHSDVVLGLLTTADKDIAEKLYFIQNSAGGVCGPMDSFLTLRGIKTLDVRMERHCKNGKVVAEYLRNHPKVDKVYWPGFEDHPGHEVAKKQMSDFGGMISFVVKGGTFEDASKVVSNLNVFTLAESLGGVESLAGHPASMTHAAIPVEERMKTGVVDGLIRLSVGIEDADDLIADLNNALNQLG